jgi:hypothetical protein
MLVSTVGGLAPPTCCGSLTAPTFAGAVQCGQSTAPAATGGSATYTDTCNAGAAQITYADTFTASCGSAGTITRTWSGTSPCGTLCHFAASLPFVLTPQQARL